MEKLKASVRAEDVRRLRGEAGRAGDFAQVALCDRALCEHDDSPEGYAAWAECERVILAGRASTAVETSECEKGGCDLCRRRRTLEGIFVARDDGTFLCSQCLALHREIDVSDPRTNVWQEGSSGWTAPLACAECKEEISVHWEEADV